MNIFERATRSKMRFPSNKGLLSVEQLWDLPLTKSTGADLDSVAKAVNAELKGLEEESFVEESTNPRKAELQVALDVVKHIIATKIREREAGLKAAETRRLRAKLEDALERKRDNALENLSEEEILKKLEEVGA